MFWKRYCALCEEKGLSPTAAGIALGVTAEAVSKWRGGSEPKTKTLDKVAAFFGVSVAYLLGHTDDRSPAQPGKEKTPAEAEEESVLDSDILRASAGLSDEAKRKVLHYMGVLLDLQQNAKP